MTQIQHFSLYTQTNKRIKTINKTFRFQHSIESKQNKVQIEESYKGRKSYLPNNSSICMASFFSLALSRLSSVPSPSLQHFLLLFLSLFSHQFIIIHSSLDLISFPHIHTLLGSFVDESNLQFAHKCKQIEKKIAIKQFSTLHLFRSRGFHEILALTLFI